MAKTITIQANFFACSGCLEQLGDFDFGKISECSKARWAKRRPNGPLGRALSWIEKRHTMIMFVHPQCPCTRASIEELNRLLAKSNGKVVVDMYFIKPRAYQGDWVKTDLWHSAAAIPGVSVYEDIDGEQAHIFGAETSGYVLLYDNHGRLLFNGGITESRGHAGDNRGENSIVALVTGLGEGVKQTPVFGCSLLNQCKTSQSGTVQ